MATGVGVERHLPEKTIGEERRFPSEVVAMDCPVCGSANPDGKRYCGDCGSSLGATGSYEQRTKDGRVSGSLGRLIGLVIANIVAVVVLVVGIYLVYDGILVFGDSQMTTTLYTFVASYWDINQLQQAIVEMIVGSVLVVLSGNYLIMSGIVRRAKDSR